MPRAKNLTETNLPELLQILRTRLPVIRHINARNTEICRPEQPREPLRLPVVRELAAIQLHEPDAERPRPGERLLFRELLLPRRLPKMMIKHCNFHLSTPLRQNPRMRFCRIWQPVRQHRCCSLKVLHQQDFQTYIPHAAPFAAPFCCFDRLPPFLPLSYPPSAGLPTLAQSSFFVIVEFSNDTAFYTIISSNDVAPDTNRSLYYVAIGAFRSLHYVAIHVFRSLNYVAIHAFCSLHYVAADALRPLNYLALYGVILYKAVRAKNASVHFIMNS